MTEEEIEAGRSPRGGFTKKQLQVWGVPWPPPHGWRAALISGRTMKEAGLLEGPSVDDLLRKVVLAIVEHGHGKILYDVPGILEYFGARNPTDK